MVTPMPLQFRVNEVFPLSARQSWLLVGTLEHGDRLNIGDRFAVNADPRHIVSIAGIELRAAPDGQMTLMIAQGTLTADQLRGAVLVSEPTAQR